MKTTVKLNLFAALLLAATLSFAGTKKFIGHSWDLLWVSQQDLVRNIDALEKLPLDGVSVRIYATDKDGKRHACFFGIGGERWQKNWDFDKPAIKRVCGGKLKENLLFTNWAPTKRISWSDDAPWETAASNMALLAALARECGARGFMFDPEDYPKSQQYTYNPAVDKGTYEETAALARKRGAQMMKAIGAEYPDIVMLSFWFLSMNLNLLNNDEVDTKLALKANGDLWSHFINGLLDTIPPGAKLVDATENAYHYEAADMDFYRGAFDIARRALSLVAPENRNKYRNQVQVGFGLYLDMYTNDDPKGTYYFGEVDGSRLNHLMMNFKQAMEVTDEYCWVYGEDYRWIKWKWNRKDTAPTWEKKLPGFEQTLSLIRDPNGNAFALYDSLARTGRIKNMIQNPACVPSAVAGVKDAATDWDTGSLPAGWSFWQLGKAGKHGLDRSMGYGDKFSAKAEGIGHGCFIVKTDVKPGALYMVSAFAKGSDYIIIRVRWQKDGKWKVPGKDVFINFKRDAKDGWKQACGLAQVPPGVNQLVVLMSCSNLPPGAVCNFDMPCVVPATFAK